MIIANPLYDTAFKGLIEDHDVASALIGTLLETEVLRVEPTKSEHLKPLADDDIRPRYLRLDYAAVIKNESGEEQKILIEVQKASGPDDVMRFREYLALAGYRKQEEEHYPLPIVTIYFLGFTLDNVPTPCLKVARQYVDMLENKVLETKEKFVELLTHDSFIIQAPLIKTRENPKSGLEKILSVFEQKNFVDADATTINYKYPVEDGYLKKMVDILHYICTDPDERRKMDNEAYWNRHDDLTIGELLRARQKLAEQGEALAQKDTELAQKDRELAESRQRAAENAKEMKSDGMPTEKISRFTGLTVDEIERL